MAGRLRFTGRRAVALFLTTGLVLVAGSSRRLVFGNEVEDRTIARGGGTTMIEGGTGSSGGFVPVLTKVAFHAERTRGGVTGSFDCLALAPEAGSGSGVASHHHECDNGWSHHARYRERRYRDSDWQSRHHSAWAPARTYHSHSWARRGGPGATSVLTVDSLSFPFHEVLLQGSFDVSSN
jgi:hypothetical protein